MFEGQTVIRERRKPVPNPHNPKRPMPGPWDDADAVTVTGAVLTSSSSGGSSATRTQAITAKSLYCDPAADVEAGDRIRYGNDRIGYVHARPEADANPFTGWRPLLEVPLEETEG